MLPAFTRWPRAWPSAALLGLLLAGCTRVPPPATPPAAKPADESALGKVTLSAEQVQSLDIKTAAVRKEDVQETRQLTGWITARQGNEVTVTAAVPGYVRDPRGTEIPRVGAAVKKDQPLLVIDPVLSPLEQIQVATLKVGIDSELKKANENVNIAKIEFDRTENLKNQGLRTDQDLDLARTKLANATEDKNAASDKQKLFGVADGKGMAKLQSVLVDAPRAGSVLAVHVGPGQYVPAGAPLVTLSDLTELWLRVPVPEYELPRVKRGQPASIVLAEGGGHLQPDGQVKQVPKNRLIVHFLAVVVQVDTFKRTADVIYTLPAGNPLVKDQMVSVFVPLGDKAKETVAPYAAVVFDAYRGSWIYLAKSSDARGPAVYERRRVELGAAVGADVVVRSVPALTATDLIVVDGAGKLFSAEFFKPPMVKAK